MKNLIVGVDGTAASLAALRWATGVVGHDGRVHAVVAVNPWTERLVDAVSGRYRPFSEVLERDLVENWTAEAGFAVGELQASVSVRPTAVALDEAANVDAADAIVVGRHVGVGGVLRRIGHSTNRLLRTTHRPVIVVPVDAGGASGLDGGNVVVGIGHGDATRSAVRWAARLARDHGVSIELLHATDDAPVLQATGPIDLARHEFGAGREDPDVGPVDHFAALLGALLGPDADVTISTPPGLAAHRLDQAAEHASLIVLGRHRSMFDAGHHTAQPLRHVLTHARCPVAVIADRPAEEVAPDVHR